MCYTSSSASLHRLNRNRSTHSHGTPNRRNIFRSTQNSGFSGNEPALYRSTYASPLKGSADQSFSSSAKNLLANELERRAKASKSVTRSRAQPTSSTLTWDRNTMYYKEGERTSLTSHRMYEQ